MHIPEFLAHFSMQIKRPSIASSAIVEQLMMMVISKMAMAASFQVTHTQAHKPKETPLDQLALLLCLTCVRLHIIMKIVSLTSKDLQFSPSSVYI